MTEAWVGYIIMTIGNEFLFQIVRLYMLKKVTSGNAVCLAKKKLNMNIQNGSQGSNQTHNNQSEAKYCKITWEKKRWEKINRHQLV